MKRTVFLTILLSLAFLMQGCAIKKTLGEVIENQKKIISMLGDQKEMLAKIEENQKEIMEWLPQLKEEIISNRNVTEEASLRFNEYLEVGVNGSVIATMKPRKTVWIRTGPSMKYQKIGVLEGGAQITMQGLSGSWFKYTGEELQRLADEGQATLSRGMKIDKNGEYWSTLLYLEDVSFTPN